MALKGRKPAKPLKRFLADDGGDGSGSAAQAEYFSLNGNGLRKGATMKLSERVRQISCLNNEEKLETMAFLKLINLGKNEISEGKFQHVEDFFAEMEKEG